MEQDYENNIVGEEAEYAASSEFSKPKLVEESVRKVIESRSKEMCEGYWNYTVSDNGVPLKKWIPDQRMIYDAAITALRNLLNPEIIENKNFQDFEKTFNEAKESLLKKYGYKELIPKQEGTKITYEESKDVYIPRIGDEVLIKKNISGKLTAIEIVGGWNRKTNFYQDEMIKLNDKLFAALNDLIANLNYFKSEISY